MKITHIKTETADEFKQAYIKQAVYNHNLAVNELKSKVLLDYTLAKAMQDKSVPICTDPEYIKDLLGKVAEHISNINVANKRFEYILEYFEHPVRACVEFDSAQEFDDVVLHNKDSVLSGIEDVRVGDAVNFVLLDDDELLKKCIRLSQVYLDDKHNWVSAFDDPYVTGYMAMAASPVNRFKLFTELVDK